MAVPAPLRTTFVQLPPLEAPVANEYERRLVLQMQRSVRRSHMREFLWISVIVAEVAALVVLRLMPH